MLRISAKIKFNGVVGSEKQNIGKDEDPYITFKDPKKSTIPPKSYENIVLKGILKFYC